MKITTVNESLSVSDQITPDDLPELADAGVKLIVCNRPDNEASQQPSFASIEQAAQPLGIEAVHIPFTADGMSQQQVDELVELVATGKKIHAYCRTGNRSMKLWNASQKAGGKSAQPTQSSSAKFAKPSFDVVVVGAGSGGIAIASSLLKREPDLRIALIDPSQEHYYQPGWTMVGGGIFDIASTKRPTQSVIPRGVTWVNKAVTHFSPDEDKVHLDDGSELHYRQLVVAPGLVLNWKGIEGLEESLGSNGVTSNYLYDLAPYTWDLVQQLKKGKAIFTQPPMPIKCAGAPQKALYLSADHWFKENRISDVDVHFFNAGPVLFGVEAFVPTLKSYMEKYQANLHFSHTLIKVDGPNKTAWFKTKNEAGDEVIVDTEFDMLHACPPQCAPDFISNSVLSDSAGWLDVDQVTLRHTRYHNIWGLGDIVNTPNAKTVAAVRKQVPVVADNLCNALNNKAPSVGYDGYGACPLTVERGKIVLAEFGYGGKLMPTFPGWLNTATQATTLAWLLKANMLPAVYWQVMLKGREWLVAPQQLSQ